MFLTQKSGISNAAFLIALFFSTTGYCNDACEMGNQSSYACTNKRNIKHFLTPSLPSNVLDEAYNKSYDAGVDTGESLKNWWRRDGTYLMDDAKDAFAKGFRAGQSLFK